MRQLLTLFLVSSLLSACGAAGTSTGSTMQSFSEILPQSIARAATAAPPVVGGCQVFPADNWWNTDISSYPVDPNSNNYINAILNDGCGQTNLHPDFGQNATYGIPFVVVPQSQPLVPMKFGYADQSNPGPYPFPPNAPIEGGTHAGGDRHVLVLQEGTCSLYETWNSWPKNNGANWWAGSGALFNLNSDQLRPNGWTSADAAGLPILPALVKCAEVQAGAIDHALRVSFTKTQAGYITPATHFASTSTNPNLPPMGLRLRLKASYNISSFNPVAKIILTAMQHYGMFVADNGSDWYFQGEGTGNNPKTCWNDNQLNQLKTVPGSAFEVVQTGTIQH